MNTEITEYKKSNGLILYDASCRFCSAAARRFRPSLAGRHLELLPLQTPGMATRLRVPNSELLAEMRFLRPDGACFGGADAVLEIARHFWWAWPLRQFGRIPTVTRLLRAAYQWIAQHRGCAAGCESGDLRVGRSKERRNMTAIVPTIHGIIDRRLLLNFRVQPDVVRKLMPSYFRPKLVSGWAMAGVCLIRLKDIRPQCLPLPWGLDSENAAHRIAVEWDEDGITREGVFIPRRDTSSLLQALAGGRLFPGVHHLADFEAAETENDFQLKMRSRDASAFIEVDAHRTSKIPATSVFESLSEASDFFARGSTGYSTTSNPNCCDGLELFTRTWKVEPLDVQFIRSSYFDDTGRFPRGTIHFDCALLMENIEHEWHVLPSINYK